MSPQEFIDSIKIAVVKSSIEAVKSDLIEPPGRSPAKEKIELSNWYNSLNNVDQSMVEKIIKDAVDSSVFGFLCVLDQVRAIEGFGDKGLLELYYIKDSKRNLLNDHKEEYLHDLFNQRD